MPPTSGRASEARVASGQPRKAATARGRPPRWLKPALFVAALVPFGALVAGLFTGGLGANPVETITHESGEWTLRLLLLTLLVTPLRRATGLAWLVRLRRMLGLFAFFYLMVHFATYAVLDAGLDLGYVVEDVLDRPYITVGFVTLCALVPLAATSTDAMIRRLGGARWRRLHRLAYFAGAGGVLHFLWLAWSKSDLREPLIYAAILVVLLVARIPAVAARLGRLAPRRAMPGRPADPPAPPST